MGSPRHLSPEAQELVAGTFRVLGEPVRLRLLQELRAGETSVSELALRLGTTQPNTSKHLRLLQEAGLVTRRQDKNLVFYAITDPMVFELCEMVCERMQDRLLAQAGTLRRRSR